MLKPTIYSVTPTVHTVHINYSQKVAVSAELLLSSGDATPMYQQIVDQITAKVMAGDWDAGQALPSIRELASASRVSVITVKRAYAELGFAGIIVTRHGMGSFVAESTDLPKHLLRTEFKQHFDAMLASAAKLGISRKEIQQLLLEDQPDPRPDSSEGPTS